MLDFSRTNSLNASGVHLKMGDARQPRSASSDGARHGACASRGARPLPRATAVEQLARTSAAAPRTRTPCVSTSEHAVRSSPVRASTMTTSPTRAQGEARARVRREVGRPQRQRREDGRVRGRHQLGSPRLVVDVAKGAVAQRLRHDEFGNVLEDTVPGFVPFGFAGG